MTNNLQVGSKESLTVSWFEMCSLPTDRWLMVVQEEIVMHKFVNTSVLFWSLTSTLLWIFSVYAHEIHVYVCVCMSVCDLVFSFAQQILYI